MVRVASMARCLRRQGYAVGRMRVRRLMAKMALAPIYQAPGTTVPHLEHRSYKYLLRDLVIAPTRSGAPTSLSRCGAASCTWSR
jgi:hypothetical protein